MVKGQSGKGYPVAPPHGDGTFHASGGWTEQRIATLLKLRDTGRSAAEIAQEIGHGCTRNSVIGKLKRLSQSGTRGTGGRRTKMSAFAQNGGWTSERIGMLREMAAQGRLAGEIACAIGHSCTKQSVVAKASVLKIKLLNAPRQTSEKREPATDFSGMDADAPTPLRGEDGKPIGLLDLEKAHCKWPLGDPRREDFHFCGLKRAGDGPYCDFHTRRARGIAKTKDEIENINAQAARTFARLGM